jgi:hypothetical protein
MLNQEMKFRLLSLAGEGCAVPREDGDSVLVRKRLATSGGGKVTITEKGLQLLDGLRDELEPDYPM